MAYLENMLSTLFSVDTGLSDEEIARGLEKIRTSPDSRSRDGIRAELISSYADPGTNWITLLENDKYEVFPAESQEDGKRFITDRIWNVLFPDNAR